MARKTASTDPLRPATRPATVNPVASPAASRTVGPAVTQPTPRPPEPANVEVKRTPTHEDIARAAYFRWLRHGGDCEQNWAEAERELSRNWNGV